MTNTSSENKKHGPSQNYLQRAQGYREKALNGGCRSLNKIQSISRISLHIVAAIPID